MLIIKAGLIRETRSGHDGDILGAGAEEAKGRRKQEASRKTS
jgi:hypothetical protein